MSSCKTFSSKVRKKCGQQQKCPTCPHKALPFSVRGGDNDPKNHLKVTVGPDCETIEKEVRLCCCNDRIHFSGNCIDVDLKEGSALVELTAANILCVSACTGPCGTGALPPASNTCGQIVVCKDTGDAYFSAECTNGEHVKLANAKNYVGSEDVPIDLIVGTTDRLPGMERDPIEGDEWNNPVDGTTVVFQNCVWGGMPCCLRVCDNDDDTLLLKKGGLTATANLVVEPPEEDGKFVWCQTGGASGSGNWVPHSSVDARNFLGFELGPIDGTSAQLDGMDRPPVNGDEWKNDEDGSTFVFKDGMWQGVPCCLRVCDNDDDTLLLKKAGLTGTEHLVIEPPEEDGKYVWCQDGPTNGTWVLQSEVDRNSKNFLGCATGAIDGTSGQLDSMDRPPMEGDEWKDKVDGRTFVFQNGAWRIAPCCVSVVDNDDDTVTVKVFGATSACNVVVEPPEADGKFVWCQTGGASGSGTWVPHSDVDARNFLGCAPSGAINGSSDQLDGMPRLPVEGDEWKDKDDGATFVFKDGVWQGVPCCLRVCDNDDDTLLLKKAGLTATTNLVVEPPEEDGKYIWCQDGPSNGNWVPHVPLDKIGNCNALNWCKTTEKEFVDLVPCGMSGIFCIDIDCLPNSFTEPGFTSLIGNPDESVTVNDVTFSFPQSSNPDIECRNRAKPNPLTRDFAQLDAVSVEASIPIRLRVDNLPSRKWLVSMWSYDNNFPGWTSEFGYRQLPLGPDVVVTTGMNSSDINAPSASFEFVSDGVSSYEFLVRGIEADSGGRVRTRFNAIKLEAIVCDPSPFGESVSISGKTFVVGSPNDGVGKVFVYDDCKLVQTIDGGELNIGVEDISEFGRLVDLSCDKLVVGHDIEDSRVLYEESFDMGPGGWTAATDGGGAAPWQFGNSTSGLDCIGDVWETNLSGDYNFFANEFIESPLLVLGGLNPTKVELEIAYDTDANFDGANLWISTDGGSYQLVDTTAGAINWYDSALTGIGSATPGPADGSPNAWNGNSNGCITATNLLTQFEATGSVQFRLYFGSDTFANELGIQLSKFTVLGPTNIIGGALLYCRDRCSEVFELESRVSEGGEFFGTSLAVAGNTVVIGDPGGDLNDFGMTGGTGTVYIYEDSLTNLVKVLTSPSTGAANSRFGASVDICGDAIVVGEPNLDDGFGGLVRVYHRDLGGEDNWGLFQSIDEGGTTNRSLSRNVSIPRSEFQILSRDGEDEMSMSGTYEIPRGCPVNYMIISSDNRSVDRVSRSINDPTLFDNSYTTFPGGFFIGLSEDQIFVDCGVLNSGFGENLITSFQVDYFIFTDNVTGASIDIRFFEDTQPLGSLGTQIAQFQLDNLVTGINSIVVDIESLGQTFTLKDGRIGWSYEILTPGLNSGFLEIQLPGAEGVIDNIDRYDSSLNYETSFARSSSMLLCGPNKFYGKEVAIGDNVLSVGLPKNVFIYERPCVSDEFEEAGQFQDSNVNYGCDLDISGQYVVAGAPNPSDEDGLAEDKDNGSVFVYDKNNNGDWELIREIDIEPTCGGSFGRSVGISGNKLISSKITGAAITNVNNLLIGFDFDNPISAPTSNYEGEIAFEYSNGVWTGFSPTHMGTSEFTPFWRDRTGPTPSSPFTGPLTDKSGSGRYVFMEASNFGQPIDFTIPEQSIATITSPAVSLNDNSVLSFYYHMFGSAMGTLSVDILDPSDSVLKSDIFVLVGQQQSASSDDWRNALVDLREWDNTDIKVRFNAMRISNFRSDMAIDCVEFYQDGTFSPSFNSVVQYCSDFTCEADIKKVLTMDYETKEICWIDSEALNQAPTRKYLDLYSTEEQVISINGSTDFTPIYLNLDTTRTISNPSDFTLTQEPFSGASGTDGTFTKIQVNNDGVYELNYRLTTQQPDTVQLTLEKNFGSFSSIQDIKVAGDRLYVIDNTDDNLQIFDITDPVCPTGPLGTVALGNGPYRMAVDGDYAYVVDSSSDDFRIVDISDSFNPNVVSTTSLGPLSSAEVVIQEDYAYIVKNGDDDSLLIYDISTPSSPLLQSTFDFVGGSDPTDIKVRGDYAYITDSVDDKLKIVDISNPSGPAYASVFDIDFSSFPSPRAIDLKDDHAFIADNGSSSLIAIDISNPSGPTFTSRLTNIPQTFTQGRLVISGDFAYIVNNSPNEITTVNISDPSNMVRVGSLAVGRTPDAFDIQGDYIYLTDASDDIKVINKNAQLNTVISKAKLEKDDGGGFAEVPGACIFNHTDTENTSFASLILEAKAGDCFRLCIERHVDNGYNDILSSNLVTVPNASAFSLKTL